MQAVANAASSVAGISRFQRQTRASAVLQRQRRGKNVGVARTGGGSAPSFCRCQANGERRPAAPPQSARACPLSKARLRCQKV